MNNINTLCHSSVPDHFDILDILEASFCFLEKVRREEAQWLQEIIITLLTQVQLFLYWTLKISFVTYPG